MVPGGPWSNDMQKLAFLAGFFCLFLAYLGDYAINVRFMPSLERKRSFRKCGGYDCGYAEEWPSGNIPASDARGVSTLPFSALGLRTMLVPRSVTV